MDKSYIAKNTSRIKHELNDKLASEMANVWLIIYKQRNPETREENSQILYNMFNFGFLGQSEM